jgi:hypothetical protein
LHARWPKKMEISAVDWIARPKVSTATNRQAALAHEDEHHTL